MSRAATITITTDGPVQEESGELGDWAKFTGKLCLFGVALTALVLFLNWDEIRNIIIKDNNQAHLVSKMNMFDTDATISSSRTSFSEDGILNRPTQRAPLEKPPVRYTVWYRMMIAIDFLICHKKSIIVILVAISLYWAMF